MAGEHVPRVSRRDFLRFGRAAVEAVYLSPFMRIPPFMKIPPNTDGECKDKITEEKFWGNYVVGPSGLGYVNEINLVTLDPEANERILSTFRRSKITDVNLKGIEVVGEERSIQIPLAWTEENGRLSRWSVWSQEEDGTIVPINDKEENGVIGVKMEKLCVDDTFVMGPVRGHCVEPFIFFIRNCGWQIKLPYNDLKPWQAPISFKWDVSKNLGEFLTK